MTDAEIEKYIADHLEEPQPGYKIDPHIFEYVMDYKARHLKAHIPAWFFVGASIACKIFAEAFEAGLLEKREDV